MKKHRTTALLALLLAALFITCICYSRAPDTTETTAPADEASLSVSFSLPSGYYDSAISVELAADSPEQETEIYYTLDGSDPTPEANRYTSPIRLPVIPGETTVYTIKSRSYAGEQCSKTLANVYVVGESIAQQYGLPILCINTDTPNLYDEDIGILVGGSARAAAETTDSVSLYHASNYAQRTSEWVREATLTAIETDGSLAAQQEIGLAVSGGSSAELPVKSLKILAAGSTEENEEKLTFSLYSQDSSDLSMPTAYNSLRLRSGSQDMYMSNIRSSVFSRLAQESGFDGYSSTKRWIVYLNGSYYGIFDMQQNYSDSFLRNRFDLPDSENIAKHKHREDEVFPMLGLVALFGADLSQPEARAALEDAVDMDNYLLYYAVNLLMNNTDWPLNNMEIWRYEGQPDELRPYSDNRWRFLMYDSDAIWLNGNKKKTFFAGDNQDAFAMVMKDITATKGNSFYKAMKCTVYRDQFLTIVCDLANTAFQLDNVYSIIDEEAAKIETAAEKLADPSQVKQWKKGVTVLKAGAEKTNSRLHSNLKKYFKVNKRYTLELENAEGIEVSWNQMHIYGGESYTNRYYRGVSFTLQQSAYPGYSFSHWLVNGEPVYEEQLSITSEMAAKGNLQIQTVSEKQETGVLVISEVSARGTGDWMKLTNVGSSSLNLKPYYLSDTSEDLMQYQLPNIDLTPGESLVIHGKNDTRRLGSYQCSFSLSEYETLYLSRDDTIVDALRIPRMDRQESYGRYLNSSSFRYFSNST